MPALGALIRGASAGLEDVERREEAKEEREYKLKRRGREEEEFEYKKGRRGVTEEREDVGYEQEQAERKHRLGRRDITETRADKTYAQKQEEYKIKTDAAQFQRKMMREMQKFTFSEGADYQGIMDVYNNEFPDGNQIQLARNPDGTFNLNIIAADGKSYPKNNVPMDEIGTRVQLLLNPDKYFSAVQTRKAKESEREFEREKITLKGEQDIKKELVKQGITIGAGGGVSKDDQNKIWKMTVAHYGKGFEGMWSFEEGQKKQSSAHNMIANLSRASGETNADAHEFTARFITDISKEAEDTAKAEAEAGTIDKKAVKGRQVEIFRALVDGAADELKARRPKPALSRTEPRKEAGDKTADGYYQYLKNNNPNKSDSAIQKLVKNKYKDWTPGEKVTEKPKPKKVEKTILKREHTKGERAMSRMAREQDVPAEKKRAERRIGIAKLKSDYQSKYISGSDSEKREWWQKNASKLRKYHDKLYREGKKINEDIVKRLTITRVKKKKLEKGKEIESVETVIADFKKRNKKMNRSMAKAQLKKLKNVPDDGSGKLTGLRAKLQALALSRKKS